MSREYKRKTPAQKKMVLARGWPWQTTVDAEDIRLREGTVDDQGIRHIEYVKDDVGSYNRQQIRNYERLGYERTDYGDYIDFTIPDEDYKNRIEREFQNEGLRLARAAALTAEDRREGFDTNELEVLDSEPETVGARDLLTQ